MGSDPDAGTTVSVPLASDQSLSHWAPVSDEAPGAPTNIHASTSMPRPQQHEIHDTISASTDSSVPQVPHHSAWTSCGWPVITARRTCSCSGPRLAKCYRLGGNLGRIRLSNAKGLGDACGRPLGENSVFRISGRRLPTYSPTEVPGACHGKTSRIVDRWPASRFPRQSGSARFVGDWAESGAKVDVLGHSHDGDGYFLSLQPADVP